MGVDLVGRVGLEETGNGGKFALTRMAEVRVGRRSRAIRLTTAGSDSPDYGFRLWDPTAGHLER